MPDVQLSTCFLLALIVHGKKGHMRKSRLSNQNGFFSGDISKSISKCAAWHILKKKKHPLIGDGDVMIQKTFSWLACISYRSAARIPVFPLDKNQAFRSPCHVISATNLEGCVAQKLASFCTVEEVFPFNNRVLRLPAIVLLNTCSKNDCWKTKNSVVECKASENVCEKYFHALCLFFVSNVLLQAKKKGCFLH